MQSSAATGPWIAKCYICSILNLFKDSETCVEMLSRWLFGKVCVWWSQYQGRAAVQTPATDLMDEVSHTHLQCEHNHLHQTHMAQHNELHSYNNVFLVTFLFRALFSTAVRSHLFSMHPPVFSLGRRESSTCFSKTQSSAVAKAIVSVKKSLSRR